MATPEKHHTEYASPMLPSMTTISSANMASSTPTGRAAAHAGRCHTDGSARSRSQEVRERARGQLVEGERSAPLQVPVRPGVGTSVGAPQGLVPLHALLHSSHKERQAPGNCS